jgi:hypothetical protein
VNDTPLAIVAHLPPKMYKSPSLVHRIGSDLVVRILLSLIDVMTSCSLPLNRVKERKKNVGAFPPLPHRTIELILVFSRSRYFHSQ